ncbi:LacI family DNA-binding transcriptional regulator [Cetobacterium sp. SF1]|uniref:LacI family DNA-binding transcriptional regulator n=1 Tax=Cetobacterium sp. SF1 TaxID=3417654 RepID=UPI003CEFFE48
MTMKEIAKALGLSVATVSRAINDKENVTPETKKRVKEFTDKIMYTPNAAAQKLASNHEKTIGLLVPNFSNPFFSELVDELCKKLYGKGYKVILYNSNNNWNLEREAIREMLSARVNGTVAILTQSLYEENPLMAFEGLNIPSILLDREMYFYKGAGIFLDNKAGSYEITKKLIEKGNRDIIFISGNLDLKTAKDRFEGYKEALREYEIPFKEENIFYGDFSLESGIEIGKKLLDKNIETIYAANNMMLMGILRILKNMRKNIQLACFDKISLLEILDYNIISCEISLEEISENVLEFIEKNSKEQLYLKPAVKG